MLCQPRSTLLHTKNTATVVTVDSHASMLDLLQVACSELLKFTRLNVNEYLCGGYLFINFIV